VPVPEHKTAGPHGIRRLFSPLLYQLRYLARPCGRTTVAGSGCAANCAGPFLRMSAH